MKPIFNDPEKDMQRRIEDKVKTDVDARINKEVDERVNTILKQREEAEKKDRADRLTKAVDKAKEIKAETGVDRAEKEKAEKEKAEKEKNDILCPTCHTGHVHKLETDKSGLVYKCHGDKCGYEFVMVAKNSDYKCLSCGSPIKRPVDEAIAKEMDGCPFCKSKRAAKFNWTGLWKQGTVK